MQPVPPELNHPPNEPSAPIADRYEDLGEPDGTLDVPHPRIRTPEGTRAGEALLALVLVSADGAVALGGLLMVASGVSFLAGLEGMRFGVTLAMHLGVIGQALLIVGVPLSILGWQLRDR